jgi:hypothetical protein
MREMMDSKVIDMVTVEEAMQAISEALRFLADNITEMLDALVHDECRAERMRVNGLSDLEEQLQVVAQMLGHEDSFQSRASLLRDVVERYREGSHPVDNLRREIEPLLHKDYGRLQLSSAALSRQHNPRKRE